MSNQIKIKKDPVTGQEFIASRDDKKFINEQSKNRYHNNITAEFNKRFSYILNPIKKNLKLLESWMQNRNEIILNIDFMIIEGYDFSCHTNSVSIDEMIHYTTGPFIFIQLNPYEIKIIMVNDIKALPSYQTTYLSQVTHILHEPQDISIEYKRKYYTMQYIVFAIGISFALYTIYRKY
jgi:hypothetical protein